MMKPGEVAILIYGDIGSGRDALSEEKYKDLASAFQSNGVNVRSVLYNDDQADRLRVELRRFAAVLVWINPIEQGKDRRILDSLLTEISGKGCFVSTHPEVIMKMGTKDVLYKTRAMDWGGDTKMYTSYEDFLKRFPGSLQATGIRVLKQYRGNGGNGVYKIKQESGDVVSVAHAIAGEVEDKLSMHDVNMIFKPFFSNNGLLVDQEWNKNTINGMVRCYLSGTKVAGFGYQEINALYELNDGAATSHYPPSKRYYFTENCGLFSDLKEIMESKWVPQLQDNLSISGGMMPIIWDADFFINKTNAPDPVGKYTLCEINVSCVSPFPPSAIKFIVNNVRERISKVTR